MGRAAAQRLAPRSRWTGTCNTSHANAYGGDGGRPPHPVVAATAGRRRPESSVSNAVLVRIPLLRLASRPTWRLTVGTAVPPPAWAFVAVTAARHRPALRPILSPAAASGMRRCRKGGDGGWGYGVAPMVATAPAQNDGQCWNRDDGVLALLLGPDAAVMATVVVPGDGGWWRLWRRGNVEPVHDRQSITVALGGIDGTGRRLRLGGRTRRTRQRSAAIDVRRAVVPVDAAATSIGERRRRRNVVTTGVYRLRWWGARRLPRRRCA